MKRLLLLPLLCGLSAAQVTPPVEGTPPGLSAMPVLYRIQPGEWIAPLPLGTDRLAFSFTKKTW